MYNTQERFLFNTYVFKYYSWVINGSKTKTVSRVTIRMSTRLPYKDFSLEGIPLLSSAQTSLIPALASPPMGAGRPNDLFLHGGHFTLSVHSHTMPKRGQLTQRSGIGTIGTYRSTVVQLHEKTMKRRNEYWFNSILRNTHSLIITFDDLNIMHCLY